MDVSGIVRRSPWGLAVVALLGLSGCLADRGWVRQELAPVQGQLAEVRQELAPVQGQLAEVRQRVAGVEQQFGRLAPKVDRLLAQVEQQQSIISYQLPVPFSSRLPESLPVEATLDLTITGGATPPRPAPVKALTPTPPGRAAHPDCVLKILKGEPC
jgi:hypothetical protein